MRDTTVAARAVGLLIGFYRRRKNLLQAEIAKGIVSTSAMAMFESGSRLPAAKTVEAIAGRLGLDAYNTTFLQALTGHHSWGMAPATASFAPEDVVDGTPIFLRTIASEQRLREKSSVKEVWICALDGVLGCGEDDSLHQLVIFWLKKGLKITIFLNLAERVSFWNEWLTKEIRTSEATGTFRLVLLPRTACPGSFILFDPGFMTSMFGRSIFCCQGFAVGTLPMMDRDEIVRAWEILDHFLGNR